MTTHQPPLLDAAAPAPAGPVVCLGQTFADDAARRAGRVVFPTRVGVNRVFAG